MSSTTNTKYGSPYSYIVYNDGVNFQARNISTGEIQFTNPSASAVFNSVINAMNTVGGGQAYVRNGMYFISSSILLKHFTGLVGEDMEKTILRSTTNANDTSIFRYWNGASSAALEGFKLTNLKLEINNAIGNGTGPTEIAWISSGTKNCEISNIWLKSFSNPSIPRIGLFLDSANNTNNNDSTIIKYCRFEGPLLGQDMLGCGNLVDCDFSHNEFRNCTAQAIGVGSSNRSIIHANRFINTGNAVGYESLCENNIISNNQLWNTSGIKLSEEGVTGIHISRNNKCVDNIIMYGMGGIEAGISIDDEISRNKFYRTERNGIRGSFTRTIIENNIFTDTNYGWFTQTLLGNTTAQKVGGIICFNSKAPTLIPKNEFNVITNNTFIKSGVKFNVGQEQESGDTGGILIDTAYTNSYLNLNKGNIGPNLLKNFGTTAS